uniref:TPM_phosphatase domain-containing protein n=1 Tax=Haemonchus contortus TaxID=6289 RepID=A0A7I4YWJ5_HAECO
MRWVILFLLAVGCRAEEWDAYNFPNPTAGEFRECKMKTTANICDPDGVLSEQARYRLDHDLKQLESRTRQDHAKSFCEKKGVTAAMAVARHVKGGSTEAVKKMANDMLRKWTLDPQCQKAVVFVVSTDDMKFWVARDDRVPVYADEFTEIFNQQKSLFQQNQYQQALTNIMQKTWEKALSKAGAPSRPSGGRGMGGGGQPAPGFVPMDTDGGKMGGGGFKAPSIPGWFWFALVGIIIPLLCCCCCIYCCCCRGKGGGGGRTSVPTTDGGMGGGVGGGGMGGGGRPGGGGSMFRNIASSMGGAGIGSILGNLISGRRGGGRGMGGMGGGGMGMGGYGGGGYPGGGYGGGDYQGGGAYPVAPGPIYDDNGGQGGGGLYPSKPVKDEGGGGSWA